MIKGIDFFFCREKLSFLFLSWESYGRYPFLSLRVVLTWPSLFSPFFFSGEVHPLFFPALDTLPTVPLRLFPRIKPPPSARRVHDRRV